MSVSETENSSKMAPRNEFDVKKLTGSENYHTWQFAMLNYLELNNLDDCIIAKEDDPNTPREEKAEKLKQAKARLALSVHESLFVHIKKATTALQIWKALQDMFEDKGLIRKIGLLRQLISVRLENSNSMQSYVSGIINTSNKLGGIGFDIDDEWLGAILLAGLTDQYKPMIMSIEGSGVKITADGIKQKLLDSHEENETSGEVFFTNKRPNFKRSFNCYSCGGKNHKSVDCPNNNSSNNNSSNNNQNNQSGSSNIARGTAFMVKTDNKSKYDWFIDSGGSSHMTPHSDIVNNKADSPVKHITTANDATLRVDSVGAVKLNLLGNETEVDGVLHVPDLAVNLLSVAKIVRNDNTVVFDRSGCKIFNAQMEVVAHCQETDGVYKVTTNEYKCMSSRGANGVMEWHRRLGHLNYQGMCKMRDGAVTGVKFGNDTNILKSCEICQKGKQARLPFPTSKSRSKGILDLIHSDLCEDMDAVSFGGARYFLTFIDDFSRKTFIYFLKSKADVLSCFIDFKMWAENQFERKIKVVRTDNGLEYCSKAVDNMCRINGIHHQRTCVFTPQQNGVAERMNRTIVERAKCMLFDAGLDKSYWAEAANMAVYLINRTVCAVLVNQTPEEVWTGMKADLSELQIFGSDVMVHVPKAKRKKWDSKSVKLVFVGYGSDKKGYRCIDPQSKKLTVSRDVIFLKKVAPVRANDSDSQCSTIVDDHTEFAQGPNNSTVDQGPNNSTVEQGPNNSTVEQVEPDVNDTIIKINDSSNSESHTSTI